MEINFLKTKKNYIKDNFKCNPDFFWKIFVGCFFLLISVSFIFSFILFKKVNNQNNLVVKQKIEKLSDKEKKKIQEALVYFAEREKKSKEISESKSVVIDPSL